MSDITDVAAEGAETAADGCETEGAGKSLPAPKNAAKDALGVYVHEFKRPFRYEGKKYGTINFYFNRLTGRDVIAIESEMQANSEYAIDPILSRNFQSKMASKASGIGIDVLEATPIQEFNRITNAARNFLISSGY
jgi:hypothetical protein